MPALITVALGALGVWTTVAVAVGVIIGRAAATAEAREIPQPPPVRHLSLVPNQPAGGPR